MIGRMLSTLVAGLLCVALSFTAQAGRSCEPSKLTVETLARSLTLAEHTARALDTSEAKVAIVARVGQDLGQYGLRYSHLGLAYRDNGGWRVVHKLNHCGSARSVLYRHGLGEFFLDGLHRYEAGVVVLAPAVAEALLPILRDNGLAAVLHEPAYNMVAYPWSVRYQQSNQWAIETLAMSQNTRISTRAQAQTWLMQRGYQPSTVRIGALRRLGARMTAANVAFDDHPWSKRLTDRIDTVTADSVISWIVDSGLGHQEMVVR
jgi:hypothetical protein